VSLTPPVLCLVTDRRRLGARLGSPPDGPATIEALLTQAEAASEAGVTLIQVREPDLPADALIALVRAIRARVAPRARVVVNDRLDVALACQADGVHLKSTSVPVTSALRLAPPGWLVGRSVHSVTEIEGGVGAGATYLVFGSVFPTRSKPADWKTAGLAGLAAAVAAASPLPVLGIGGIGPDQTADVARTGAAGLAAIDAFLPSDPARIADTVHEAVHRLRIAFDWTLPFPNMSGND
jgi:thiamine-phosphate pyrophosphorylase